MSWVTWLHTAALRVGYWNWAQTVCVKVSSVACRRSVVSPGRLLLFLPTLKLTFHRLNNHVNPQ